MNRVWILVGLGLLGACSQTSKSTEPRSADARPVEDVVRLTNGDVVNGRIVEETPSHVMVERDQYVSAHPRSTVYSIDYAKERYLERTQPLRPAEAAPASARPATSWYPRADARDRVDQTEVLWFDGHSLAECLGPQLSKAHQDFPDLRLFADPGGKIVLHDPRKWGYHAHLQPGGFARPAEKPGLSIDIPRDEASWPDAVAFVSPAQEMKAGENGERSSYAVPDAVYAKVKPVASAEAILAGQPFAGGRPVETRNGTIWAFALPRSSRQFFVYLLDPGKKHGESLKSAFAAYGDTILAADLAIDTVAADGVTVGRVLVVPFPDGISADGPAPEPVTVYTGPAQDPTRIAAVPLPPRQSVQVPPRAPSTQATVLVSHYEVADSVPQSIVIAYGTGRPTKDVTLVGRELTSKQPDETVRIDLSSLPEDRFPAVCWFYQRRTFAWRSTGGHLPKIPPLSVPPSEPRKLERVKKSDPIPHVLPILFHGPKPDGARPGSADPAAGVAGGMASGLMQDALAREAGSSFFPTVSLSPSTSVTPGTGGGSTGDVINQTYLNVIVPPPSGVTGGVAGVSGSSAAYPFGTALYTQPGWNSNVGYLRGGPSSPLNYTTGTRDPAGNYYNSAGQQTFNNAAAAQQYYGSSSNGNIQFVDQNSGAGITIRRRTGAP
jgi:hypothetical protein